MAPLFRAHLLVRHGDGRAWQFPIGISIGLRSNGETICRTDTHIQSRTTPNKNAPSFVVRLASETDPIGWYISYLFIHPATETRLYRKFLLELPQNSKLDTAVETDAYNGTTGIKPIQKLTINIISSKTIRTS